MGLNADAIAIAAGEKDVLQAEDALDVAVATPRRPIPLAAFRGELWCAVFFVIKHGSGADWNTEIALVRDGDVLGPSGATGGIVARAEVEPGEPIIDTVCGFGFDDDRAVMAVAGVSADEKVKLVYAGTVVAETPVAAHGFFLLAAVLPWDAEVAVEAT